MPATIQTACVIIIISSMSVHVILGRKCTLCARCCPLVSQVECVPHAVLRFEKRMDRRMDVRPMHYAYRYTWQRNNNETEKEFIAAASCTECLSPLPRTERNDDEECFLLSCM